VDPADEQALARWKEGAAAFSAGRYETARNAFLQAYSIRPHPAFLQNLGEAELRTGHYVEAATHLRDYLQAGIAKPDERAKALASFEGAMIHVGRLVIEATVAAAEVRVDGKDLREPASEPRPLLVSPGVHAISASKAGYVTAQRQVDVGEGVVTHVKLELAPLIPDRSADEIPLRKLDEPAPTRANVATNHRSDLRSISIIVGAGLTTIALGTGTYFAIKRSGDLQRANELRTQLSPYNTASGLACFKPLPETAGWCSELNDRMDAINFETAGERIAFVSGAVLGVATLAAVFLWPRESGSSPTASLVPFAGRQATGLQLVGSY